MDHSDIDRLEDLMRLPKEYHYLAEREKALRVVHHFANSLLHQNSINDIVWAIARNAIAKLGLVDCVIYLMNEQGDALVQVAAHGPKNPQEMDIMNPIIITLGTGIVGTVAETGKAEVIGDTSTDSRYIVDDDFRYSEIAVPILDGEKVIGVIDSEHPDKNFFTPQHLDLLETIAAMAASKILHAKAVDQLKHYQKGLEQQIEEKTKDLREHIDQLKKSNYDLQSFAYAASHDLAEPLRTISSFLQLIEKREHNLSEDSVDFLNFAIDGANRMRKLLDGLLIYSRADRKQEDFEVIDINITIETVKSNLSKLIEDKNAQIEHSNLFPINGHGITILQLFQNLISNAIKFQHANRVPIIQLKQIEKEDYFLFSVKDNGIGIEQEFFDKAFKLFGKLHTIDKYQGSGLGFALCKRVVENHGGKIWLDSILDEGTTVYFTIKKI